MNIRIGDIVTVANARDNLRDLPCTGKANGRIITEITKDYLKTNERIFRVRFFVNDSVWAVGEFEIIANLTDEEKVIFS